MSPHNSKTLSIIAGSALLIASNSITALELVIGEERVEPGIVFIFEGAIKDEIMPQGLHLPEAQTDVHIEARVNWDSKDIPAGTPAGGFVPYLNIVAEVKNEQTGMRTFVDLTPHLNLIDNFHYARNIALPGKRSDSYRVTFTVLPPAAQTLGLHKDWVRGYGNKLSGEQQFTYSKVDFEEIANASRQ